MISDGSKLLPGHNCLYCDSDTSDTRDTEAPVSSSIHTVVPSILTLLLLGAGRSCGFLQLLLPSAGSLRHLILQTLLLGLFQPFSCTCHVGGTSSGLGVHWQLDTSFASVPLYDILYTQSPCTGSHCHCDSSATSITLRVSFNRFRRLFLDVMYSFFMGFASHLTKVLLCSLSTLSNLNSRSQLSTLVLLAASSTFHCEMTSRQRVLRPSPLRRAAGDS